MVNIKNITFSVEMYIPQSKKISNIAFSNMIGKKFFIVFYPKDFSFVCTKQICDYSNHLSNTSTIQMFASSYDTIQTHKRFAEKFNIQIPLIADVDKKLAKFFSVQSSILKGVNKRAIFLINENGKIEWKKIEKSIIFRTKSKDIMKSIPI